MKTVGILALQGAFKEHGAHVKALGHEVQWVRHARDLEGIEALILPGGESTTMGKFLKEGDLKCALIQKAKEGMPIWGTCAGMILLAKALADAAEPHLALMDICVKRNAYGRQLGSFTVTQPVTCLGKETPLTFIRAPYIESCGEGVEILHTVGTKVVAARQGRLLATAFHPELTEDSSWHAYFLNL